MTSIVKGASRGDEYPVLQRQPPQTQSTAPSPTIKWIFDRRAAHDAAIRAAALEEAAAMLDAETEPRCQHSHETNDAYRCAAKLIRAMKEHK